MAKLCVQTGDKEGATKHFSDTLHVTHEMVLEVIPVSLIQSAQASIGVHVLMSLCASQELKALGVEIMVAPF